MSTKLTHSLTLEHRRCFDSKSIKVLSVTRGILFGSNMHQIFQRLRLHPRPHWGAHSASLNPIAGTGEERRGRRGEGKGTGRGEKQREVASS